MVKVKLSCVIAIHNEEKYLPYSLLYLSNSIFDEVIVVLDRCTDNSERLIRKITDDRFVIIQKKVQTWENGCSEAKNIGCERSTGDVIMITDPDVILDINSVKKAMDILKENNKIEIIVFIYKLYTLFSNFERIRDEWLNLFGKITRKLKIQPVRSGIYMIRKPLAVIPDTVGQYDVLQQKYKCSSIITQ